MEKKRLLAIAGCVLLILAVATPAAHVAAKDKPIELIYSNWLPASHTWPQADVAWQKKITQKTNGRVTFKNYFGGTLIGAPKAFVELMAGSADITFVLGHYQAGEMPIQMASMSFYWAAKSAGEVVRLTHKAYKKFPVMAKEWDAGGKTLAIDNPGPFQLHTTRKAVRTLADIKGMQLRGIGPFLKKTLAALGGSAVAMPPPEVYIALQKNIMDGYFHPWESLRSMKFSEVTKYHSVFNFCGASGGHMMMNWDTYNGLPADIRKVIDDSLDEYQRSYIEPIEKNNREINAEMKADKDHEVINVSPEELAKFQKLLDAEAREWAASLDAKGLPGTQIYEFIRQEAGKN